METFSTTQAANLTAFAGAIVTLIAKLPLVLHPTLLGQDDIVGILASIGIIGASIVSFINRYKKGDLTILGSRKE